MTDARYLVHGVFWPAPPDATVGADVQQRPFLRLQAPDGTFHNVTLDAGTRLGFRLAAGGKYCLGHPRSRRVGTGVSVPVAPRTLGRVS